MQSPDKTIDHSTLRRLVDAGANVGAEVVSSVGGSSVGVGVGVGAHEAHPSGCGLRHLVSGTSPGRNR